MKRSHRLVFLLIAAVALGTFIFGMLALMGLFH
jgi:hypothetical protein